MAVQDCWGGHTVVFTHKFSLHFVKPIGQVDIVGHSSYDVAHVTMSL